MLKFLALRSWEFRIATRKYRITLQIGKSIENQKQYCENKLGLQIADRKVHIK